MKRLFLTKKLILILSALLLTLTGCNTAYNQQEKQPEESTQNKAEIVDYSEDFNDNNGCAVFYEVSQDKYTYFNKNMCKKQYSPLSTFKIIAAATALESGIINTPNDKMQYSGDNYPFENWNNNLGLKDAFKESCVWYFRQLIDKIGNKNMQKYIDKLNYGNKDISQWNGSGLNKKSDLNGFWLGSSLKISPENQIEVLKNIFESGEYFSEKTISILKDIMLVKNNNNIKIYGKTGTGMDNTAWFTGFSEQCGFRTYFAIYISNGENKQVAGADAREIAIKILEKYYKK